MDRAEISHLAHAAHPIASPISDARVQRLLATSLSGRRRVLDLGCGDGSWLLRGLVAMPQLHAVGVDLSGAGFDRVRAEALRLGVDDRLRLIRADATTHISADPVDVVLSVGAAHAFGGMTATLDAARGHLGGDGVVLFGDGFWAQPPTPRVLQVLDASEEDYADLPTTIDRITAAGWDVLEGHVSSTEEWDDYEWSWTGSLLRWTRANPGHPDAEQVRQVALEHRDGWLAGYRETLGFLTVVLAARA